MIVLNEIAGVSAVELTQPRQSKQSSPLKPHQVDGPSKRIGLVIVLDIARVDDPIRLQIFHCRVNSVSQFIIASNIVVTGSHTKNLRTLLVSFGSRLKATF